jgi:outer membrane protein TolC
VSTKAAKAEPEPADPSKPWTLEALVAAAERADPRVLAALAELERARSIEAEARAARGPVLDWSLQAIGPVPELSNDPDHIDDVRPGSRLRTGELGSVGVHTRFGAVLTVPLYDFGRSRSNVAAAAHGGAASAQSARGARLRAARDAAEVYWSCQLARRLLAGLEEADRQLAGARDRMERLLAGGSYHVSRQDLAQVDVLRAELAARRADAAAAHDLALESARLLAGAKPGAPFALAPSPLEAPTLPLQPLTRYQEAALARRPEVVSALEVVRARESALAATRRDLLPELVAFGAVDLNWTGSTTPQTNPFAWDPYNRLWGELGLALTGSFDLMGHKAGVARASAELDSARAEAAQNERAVLLEVAAAHFRLRRAVERLARLRDEESAAKRWLNQAEVAFEAGKSGAQAVLLAALTATRAFAERLAAAKDAQLGLADLALAIGGDPQEVVK